MLRYETGGWHRLRVPLAVRLPVRNSRREPIIRVSILIDIVAVYDAPIKGAHDEFHSARGE